MEEEEHKQITDDRDPEYSQIDFVNQNRPQLPETDLPIEHHNHHQGGEQGFTTFTDEEVANLREIFDLFDKEKTGFIEVKDLETIMGSL